MKRRLAWVAIAVAVLGIALIVYWRPGQPQKAQTSPAPAPAQPASTNAAGEDPVGAPLQTDAVLESLKIALESKDVGKIRQAANEVRQKAIQDPAFLRLLGQVILDDRRPMQIREVVSLVLGTIRNPEAEQMLVQSLGRVSDVGLLRCLVNAIGSLKEDDDDECFGGLDNPSVIEHASGLQIMVRTKIDNPTTSRALLALMNSTSDPELRGDAARALRLSLDQQGVRSEFLKAIRRDYDGRTIGELGAALSSWAAGAAEEKISERNEIVGVLLDLSQKPEHTGLRFFSEGSLGGMTFSKEEVAKTTDVYEKSKDFDVRYWALSMLNRQASLVDRQTRESVRTVCIDAINHEKDGKLRELAAQGLGKMRDDPAATGALLRTVQQDQEWNVRDAAAEALGEQPNEPSVIAILEQVAANDPNVTVRQTAARSLQQVKSREPGVPPSE